MLVGYARVSTTDQNLDLQREPLEGSGFEEETPDEYETPDNAPPAEGQAGGSPCGPDGKPG